MLRLSIGIGAVAALCSSLAGTADAGAPAPLAWSPDGEWISYVVESPPGTNPLRTGWVFEAPEVDRDGVARPTPLDPRRYRLWATKVGSDVSILLDEGSSPITPPGWSPDGRSLAYGRVVSESGGRRFEVVCLEGARRRILSSQPVNGWGDDPSRLARSAIAWSGDGRFLAVPSHRPAGLAIVRAENGRTVKVIESAEFPAWAPDGSRLFFITTGDQERLECLDSHFGATRQLAEVGQVDGPPLVARNGQSAMLLSRNRMDRGASAPTETVVMSRVRLEDGWKERVTTLFAPDGRDRVVAWSSMTQDRDGENFLSTLAVSGLPGQVTWFRPRERSVFKVFPVLDTTIAIGDLSLCPSGGILALRLGGPGASGVPVLCDLESFQLTPLVPDEPTRSSWAALLIETASTIIGEGGPRPILEGRAVGRPVALPMPGEVGPGDEFSLRLRRLGRLGRPLVEAKGGQAAGPSWDEARFLFDYLQEDFPKALAELEALDARKSEPGRRLPLLALRAGVFAGMGDFDRARATLGYLEAIEPRRSRRVVEETSIGPFIIESPAADAGWARYARGRVDALAEERNRENDDSPTGPDDHRNPDAPSPGLGLDPPLPASPFVEERLRPPGRPPRVRAE